MFNFLLIIFILNFFIYIFHKPVSKIYNLFDYPDNNRKIHNKPIPLLGGLFLIFNLLIILIYKKFFYNFNFFENLSTYNYFFLITLFFYFLGFYDDKYKISYNIKFFLTITLVILTLYFDKEILLKNIFFSFSQTVIHLGYLSYFITILCFLLFINAFNMLDGINGQAACYALFIFLLFISKSTLILFSIIIIINLLFFLLLNFRNKSFFGDSGSLPFGFMISYIFIKLYNTNKIFLSDEVFLVMSVPGYELLRLAFERILNKKHPFLPDKNHIHHLIMNKCNYIKTFFIVQLTLIIPYISYILYNKFYISFVISLIIYFSIIIIFSKKKKSEYVYKK
jgi:UDP-GlcNAc:undecaprenyl-phosphate GlcNAc-1-phosphate transferase